MKEKEIIELKERIKKLERKLKIGENSCSTLQAEEFQSYEQDRFYLNLLKDKLKIIDE